MLDVVVKDKASTQLAIQNYVIDCHVLDLASRVELMGVGISKNALLSSGEITSLVCYQVTYYR